MDKLALMLSYEINPSSGPVVAQRILDIRHVVYDERGSYKLPDELKERHFVRQIGLVPKGEEAYVCMQPPAGIYIPDFGYGPITGKITTHTQEIPLVGDYDRFPELRRNKTKTIYVREITEDGMPRVSGEVFNALNSYVKHGPLTEKALGELMKDPAFCRALVTVFRKARFGIGFSVPPRQARAARRPKPTVVLQEYEINL